MTERTDDFTAVLSSASNLNTDPTNKPTDFRVRFQTPIRLASHLQWEAALLNFHYPYNWWNVAAPITLYFVKCHEVENIDDYSSQNNYHILRNLGLHKPNEVGFRARTSSFLRTFCATIVVYADEKNTSYSIRSDQQDLFVVYKRTLDIGIYDSVQALQKKVCELANELPGLPVKVKSEFDQKSGRCTFTLFDGKTSMAMISNGTYFGDLLGLPSKNVTLRNPGELFVHAWTGVSKPQLAQTDTIYVYAENLIEHQIVCDVTAPLLDYVPVDNDRHMRRIPYEFPRPAYAKVITHVINDLRIILRSTNGLPIPFPTDSQPVTCRMSFRVRRGHNAI